MKPQLLPNLFVPGAAKSGTTTLSEHLSKHRDVYMAPNKEPHYFTRSDKGIDYYSVMYSRAGNVRYRADASTGYMVSDLAVKRIAALVSEPRFIFIFRNPIDRAWSHHTWARARYGFERRPFRSAFLADHHDRVPDPMPLGRGYYHHGTYDRWIARYYETFGRSCVHIMVFEDLVRDHVWALDGVCRFLEIDAFEDIAARQANETAILRFPGLLRAYEQAGSRVGKGLRHIAPPRAQVPLARLYHAAYRRGSSMLAHAEAPSLSAEDRSWIAEFYRSDVESLRFRTGLAFEAWDGDFPQA